MCRNRTHTLSSKLDQTLSSSIVVTVIRIWARLRIETILDLRNKQLTSQLVGKAKVPWFSKSKDMCLIGQLFGHTFSKNSCSWLHSQPISIKRDSPSPWKWKSLWETFRQCESPAPYTEKRRCIISTQWYLLMAKSTCGSEAEVDSIDAEDLEQEQQQITCNCEKLLHVVPDTIWIWLQSARKMLSRVNSKTYTIY